jgi:hypothetical protein
LVFSNRCRPDRPETTRVKQLILFGATGRLGLPVDAAPPFIVDYCVLCLVNIVLVKTMVAVARPLFLAYVFNARIVFGAHEDEFRNGSKGHVSPSTGAKDVGSER